MTRPAAAVRKWGRGLGRGLRINPHLPSGWPEASLTRHFRGASYEIHIRRDPGTIRVWPCAKGLLDITAWLNQLLNDANTIVAENWFANPARYFPTTDDDSADGATDGKVTFTTPVGTEQWTANTFGSRAHDIATVAFAHKVTGNAAYAGAKDMMLRIAAFPSGARTLSWPEYHGSTSKQSTAISEFLAVIYDWYYAELTPTQRTALLDAVRLRVEKVLFDGRSWRSGGAGSLAGDAYYNGVGIWGDSHPYQNFMWTLPAALLMAGEHSTHDSYGAVPLFLDFLNGVTSSATYGHDDGGVNEGPGYAGEKQGAMLRAALATRLLLPGLQVQNNPYFAGYQRYYSHLIPTDYGRIPFGDQWSNTLDNNALVENMRLLTLLSGDGRAKARWEALVADNGSDPYAKDSMSNNVLLVDGKGQGWTNPGQPSVPYMGRLLSYTEGPWYVHWVGDATNAYRENGIPLKRWHRHVLLVDNAYFVLYDDVELDDTAPAATLSWLLQADTATTMTVGAGEFSWTQSNVNARVVFAADPASLSIVRRTGNDIFNNLVTGVGSLAATEAKYLTQGNLSARPTYNDAYPPDQRTASQMWVSTTEKQKRWQLISALLAWTGATAPSVNTLNDRAMQITSGNSTRTISFNPNTPGDLNIDLNSFRVHAGETLSATPLVSVRFAESTVAEGGTATLQFVRADQYDETVTVNFSLSGNATYGLDYAPSQLGAVTIPAGAAIMQVPIYLHDDTAVESGESLTVTLQPSPAFTINAGEATLTIADNDTLDTFTISEAIGESTSATLPVTIHNPTASSQNITLTTIQPASLTEGYVWNTSNRYTAYPEAPAFDWVDLTTLPNVQTNTFSAATNGKTNTAMSMGFTFPFFTTSHGTIYATTNGYAMFANGLFDLSWNPQRLPYTASDLAKGELSIMPFWNFLTIHPDSTFYYAQVDSNTFAMQWDNVGFTAAHASRRMTFQVLLRRDGRITFNYRDYNPPANNDLYTIGLQNHDRNKAVSVAHAPSFAGYGHGPVVPQGTGINFSMRFRRQPNFLTLGNSSFTLAAGESRTVNATISPGTTLGGDTYHSTLRVEGSASGLLREIPVAMEVTANGTMLAPRRLSASVGGTNQVVLAWDDVTAGETGFEIQRGTSAAGPFTTLTSSVSAKAQAFADNTATNAADTGYFYRVRALGSGGPSTWSPTAGAGGPSPATPSGLTTTVRGMEQVDLTWSLTGADYYILQRSTGGGAFADIAYTTNTQFADIFFAAERNYSYRLIAVNGSGQSAAGTTALATLPALQDAVITSQPASVTIAGGQSATLAVQATGTGLSYQWYRGISGNATQPISGATLPNLNTGALADDARYWVRVTGVSGVSADSQTATVRVNDLLVYEGFSDYPAGSDVRNASGGTGWNAPWAVSGGTIPGWPASATGLEYSSASAEELETSGGALDMAPSTWGHIQRSFTIPAAKSGTDVWFSVVVHRYDTLSASYSDGFQFSLLDSGGNVRVLVDGKKETTLMHVTRTPVGSTAATDPTTIPTHGLRFIVGRLTTPGGTADSQLTLWADPSPLRDITTQTPAYVSPAGLNLPEFTTIRLGIYGGRKGRFDEIRLGFNSGSVLPVAAVAAPLAITSAASLAVVRGHSLTHTITGNLGGETWSVPGGLPAWLSLVGATLQGTIPQEAPYRTPIQIRASVAGQTADQTLTLTVTNAVNIAPADWKVVHNLSGPVTTTDSDGDGWVDLLEYALGGDPTTPGLPEPPASDLDTSGRLVFEHIRRKGQESLCEVLASTDLASWQPASIESTATTDLGNGFERVTLTLAPPASPARQFARLRVSEN